MQGAFITATGTGIGKTFLTAGLIHHLRREGRAVDALKPVVSGFDPARPEASDPGHLLAALGRRIDAEEIAAIAPWCFWAPLSPDVAAAREGRVIDFRDMVAFCKKAIAQAQDLVLIEGAGGVMVPLDDHRTILDWIGELPVPVLLVAGSYLGTISHTLTALDVLQRRGCDLRAVVVDETPDSPVPLDVTVRSISRFSGPAEVVALPRLSHPAEPHPTFARLAAML